MHPRSYKKMEDLRAKRAYQLAHAHVGGVHEEISLHLHVGTCRRVGSFALVLLCSCAPILESKHRGIGAQLRQGV